MATEPDFDIASLTETQQEALQQYTDVTSQEIKDAIPLLERSQWNVQVSSSMPCRLCPRAGQAVKLTNCPADCHCQVL
jgi:hypothetical protein